MKRTFLLLLFAVVALSACKKKSDGGFSKEILNIVPQKTIDSLRKWGMQIYEGKKPPMIEGVYLTDDRKCTFDNGPRPRLGYGWADYYYRFYNQDNKKLTISVDYQTTNKSDVANGIGSFISGNGSEFSAFFEVEGVSDNIPYKSTYIFSGRKTADGIVDWMECFLLKEKGNDPTNILVPVGTSRIFKEQDGLAEKATMPKTSQGKTTMDISSKVATMLSN